MKQLLTVILLMVSLGALVSAEDLMRHVEDRASEGDRAAIRELRDSAEAGSLRAMNYLGFLYWQGLGTRLDRDSALYYLRGASERGDVKASANLGHLLLVGAPELTPDTVGGLRLLDYAAGHRSSAAMRELDDYFGHNPTPRDSAGVSAMNPALREVSASALKKVGDARSHGFLLPYDYRKAIQLYDRAAALGDTVSQRIIDELLEIFPDAL